MLAVAMDAIHKFDETKVSTYLPHRVVKQAVLVPVPEGIETLISIVRFLLCLNQIQQLLRVNQKTLSLILQKRTLVQPQTEKLRTQALSITKVNTWY